MNTRAPDGDESIPSDPRNTGRVASDTLPARTSPSGTGAADGTTVSVRGAAARAARGVRRGAARTAVGAGGPIDAAARSRSRGDAGGATSDAVGDNSGTSAT